MGSDLVIGIFGVVLLFVLLAIRMPVAFTLTLISLIGIALVNGPKAVSHTFANVPISGVASYSWSVIPLFVLMGNLASESGVIEAGFRAFHKWLGHLRGGMAYAVIATCAVFAACTGSSVASVGFLTKVALPEMESRGYKSILGTGAIASGSTLGILIPPSIPFVVYGLLAEQSIGKLYMAGIIPGIILTGLFMLVIFCWAWFDPEAARGGPKAPLRERIAAISSVWPFLIIILAVLGTIWGGIATPVESASLGVVATAIVSLVQRRLTLNGFMTAVKDTMVVTGMIGALLIGALLFTSFMAQTGLPAYLADWTTKLSLSLNELLLIVFVFFFVGGCVMDSVALTLIGVPILVPILNQMNFNLVLFGVFVVIMIEMALISPPFGMNVFIMGGIARHVPMERIFMGIIPFLVVIIVCLWLVIAFPQLALYLPTNMIAR
jgi:tripartite ATP-independent transporter DctM subunit